MGTRSFVVHVHGTCQIDLDEGEEGTTNTRALKSRAEHISLHLPGAEWSEVVEVEEIE